MEKCIKNKEALQKLQAYTLIKEEYLEDLKSFSFLLKHKKSGARVILLSNEDDNKVFSIGFRTPPEDSTGVAHIVEHTVLCGSREFQAKDPFIELVKGSLNTFLNAITYSDKTIYPLASCNEKDFQNLMHVYLDAVFYPNIYQKREIFEQEGWHYELESAEGEVSYNGVVYNEMKGAFSSPDQKLFSVIQSSLFPDTAYGTESGGNPDCIPDLTYEQFLEFHGRYYHPANSYIYLYGDMDMEEKLTWMDEHYLSHFDKIEVDSQIKMQKPFSNIKEIIDYYSIAEGESGKEKTYLSYNVVVGTSLDQELYLAFQILNYVLLSAPGAPLKQALIHANIGTDILSSYDNSILQPVFSIVAKNTDKDKKEEFVTIIMNTLKELTASGLDENSLLAAIHYYEFRYREGDFGQYPKGLMYGIQILDSWLYDESVPFIHIQANKTFALLKEKIGTRYYEDLIQKYLLDNTFGSIVIIEPKEGLTTEIEAKTAEKLKNFKASLSKTEIEVMIENTKNLKKYQEEPSSQEDLEKIPMLSIQDIEKKVKPFKNTIQSIDNIEVIHHDVETNGIAYLTMAFSVDDYIEFAPYLSLLTNMLGYMDTNKHSYLELSNEINIYTGGIGTSIEVYNEMGKTDVETTLLTNNTNETIGTKTYFTIGTKVLYEHLDKALDFIKEMMFDTNVRDEKRLKEIIAEAKSRMQMHLNASGHAAAMNRAISYFSKKGKFYDITSGLGYYRFLDDLDLNFEKNKDALMNVLEYLLNLIFLKEKQNMLLSFTANQEGFKKLEQVLPQFSADRKAEKIIDVSIMMEGTENNCFNEGFKTSGQVQYVARAGNFREAGEQYTGSLRVLKVILGYEYLWNQVRVKGGAYGCMCGFAYDGCGYLVSYRDPNLAETNEIFEKTPDYVAHFEVDDRDMTKYVIGAISSMDMPLTPSAQGRRSFSAYISGLTEERLQQERDEVLGTNQEKIRQLGPIVKAMIDANYICVIGNESKILGNKDLFQKIENLL